MSSWVYEDKLGEASVSSSVADRTEFWWNPKRPDEPMLWESKIYLGEAFFHEIIRHPVPIDMNTLQALMRCSLGLDLYLWLTPTEPSRFGLHSGSHGDSCTASSTQTRPKRPTSGLSKTSALKSCGNWSRSSWPGRG